MIRASISSPPMHPSIGAPPLPVALAELDELVERALDAMDISEELVEEFLDTVIGTKRVPNSVVAVGDVSGAIVTVTLTTVNPGAVELVVGPDGSGGADSQGCGVTVPESWRLVGMTVTLGAEVVKVSNISLLATS